MIARVFCGWRHGMSQVQGAFSFVRQLWVVVGVSWCLNMGSVTFKLYSLLNEEAELLTCHLFPKKKDILYS